MSARLQRLVDAAPYHVDFSDGSGEDLVIAFASVGHDPSRAPSPEFVATATGRGIGPPRRALFVMDASRSWANDPGFDLVVQRALKAVQARAPVRRIAVLGQSMGAFSALVAAQLLPVDVVLAFSPQWSVQPGLLDERRWSQWTDALPQLRWPIAPLPQRGWTCLFHGAQDDLPQALPFPAQANCDHLIFADHSHSDLLPHLKARGVLAGLLQAALAQDRPRLLRIASSAGGLLRRRYEQRQIQMKNGAPSRT